VVAGLLLSVLRVSTGPGEASTPNPDRHDGEGQGQQRCREGGHDLGIAAVGDPLALVAAFESP
jgi:hypothetical protein